MCDDAVPNWNLRAFCSNLELAPVLRAEPIGNPSLEVQMVYRGLPGLLSFAPLPSDWSSSPWAVFSFSLNFWQGALVPMDLFPDFAPGRGFTLAYLWMIPTTCIPAGRMVLGVDDFVNFCGPLRLLLRCSLCQDRASPGKRLTFKP